MAGSDPGRYRPGAAAAASVIPAGMPQPEAGFRDWIARLRMAAVAGGVPGTVFDRQMRAAVFLPEVVQRDRNQTEDVRAIWDYLDLAVSAERLALGQAALADHAALFDRIAAEYGVGKEVIAAIWGLETRYGAVRGTVDTICALATLAFEGRRAALFQDELLQALNILAGGHVARSAMIGSWAGAMGHMQFMPSSWRAFAVDADGDGRCDIWGPDPADALASAANYLRHWGWIPGQPWGLEVALPPGFDFRLAGRGRPKPAIGWQALGVRAVAGDLPDAGAAEIHLPAGAAGPAFLLLPNFHVLARYNRADAYVLAVGHLSDRLAGGPALARPWPRHSSPLSAAERVELQQRLVAAGYDTGGIDGRIGPKTLAAVRAWQETSGMVPDGHPDPEVLAKLRKRV